MATSGEGGIAVPEPVLEQIHAQRGRMSARQRMVGEDRLVARWKGRRSSRLRPVLAVAAALALVATGMAAFEHWASRTLSYALEGARIGRDGALELDPGAAGRLHFSDGSDVALNAGTHASLRRVDAHGAVVSVSGGSAFVDITHRPESRWSFEAGPFVIEVTGTAFRFAWDPSTEEFDLRMDRGSVRVSGPLSDGALAVRSGQHLMVRVRQGETVIREHETPQEAAMAAPPAGSVTAESNAPAMPLEASSAFIKPHATAPEADWQGRVASGDFEGVVRDAERRGIDESIAAASSADLAALADAARYSRHDDIARRALLGQRRRFPASQAAHDAAFLLGRLQETGQDTSGALDWYGQYLREAADGTYASDALGRKMLLYQQSSNGAAARAAARGYLSRFPGGPYAARARALLQTP
jgi:TolA-binding protein